MNSGGNFGKFVSRVWIFVLFFDYSQKTKGGNTGGSFGGNTGGSFGGIIYMCFFSNAMF